MTTAALTLDLASSRRHLLRLIGRALTRLRMQEALNATMFSVSVAMWIMVPLVFLDRLLSLKALGIPIWIVGGSLFALCIPYVIMRAFSNRINERFAAVLADDRLALHSRLCTALALNPNDASEFSEAFYAEATETLGRLDPTKAFPISMPRIIYALPVPMLIAGLLFLYMPQQDKLGFVADQQQKRLADSVKKETLRNLDGKLQDMKGELDEEIEKGSAQYEIQQLIKKADQIAKQVAAGKRNPEEAIIAIADLKREIGEERENLAKGKDFMSRLKNLSAEDLNLEESAFTRDISEALKSGDASLAAREMRKLARDLKKNVLENESLSSEQKAEAMKKVKNEMERLAGALAEQEVLKGNLKEISEKAMESSEFESLQDEIKKYQAENGGPSSDKLAEELEDRMDDAADDLERLEDENEDSLNEDEEETMEKLDELEEAADEFMEGMGECSECEGGAKAGGKSTSGKSGGKSAKGKSLSGKSGSSSKGRNGNQGRKATGGNSEKQAGQREASGAPGSNGGRRTTGSSAVPPPNYRDGDSSFRVEKVSGKMQSGAITGLSHFRGQGAKGNAPKEYVQALQAAEQESTSSLELDRIPADARSMVKDYFLSLKKDAGIKGEPVLAPTPADSKPKSETFDGTESLDE